MRFILFLCAWLLPLFVIASLAPEVSLRLIEGTSRPGDIVELQGEMRGMDYAEFELHVPANAQLHFVTLTREPVRYVEGLYIQRVLLQLQPLSVGDFDLNGIAVTITQDGVTREIVLPLVSFTVASYAAEDSSDAVAELAAIFSGATMATNNLRITIGVLFVALMFVWLWMRKVNAKLMETAEAELGLSDLIMVLEENAPSLLPCESDEWKRGSVGSKSVATLGTLYGCSEVTPVMIAERLLQRADLSMSLVLRQHLEAAVYANRLDSAVLLQLLREEVAR